MGLTGAPICVPYQHLLTKHLVEDGLGGRRDSLPALSRKGLFAQATGPETGLHAHVSILSSITCTNLGGQRAKSRAGRQDGALALLWCFSYPLRFACLVYLELHLCGQRLFLSCGRRVGAAGGSTCTQRVCPQRFAPPCPFGPFGPRLLGARASSELHWSKGTCDAGRRCTRVPTPMP